MECKGICLRIQEIKRKGKKGRDVYCSRCCYWIEAHLLQNNFKCRCCKGYYRHYIKYLNLKVRQIKTEED